MRHSKKTVSDAAVVFDLLDRLGLSATPVPGFEPPKYSSRTLGQFEAIENNLSTAGVNLALETPVEVVAGGRLLEYMIRLGNFQNIQGLAFDRVHFRTKGVFGFERRLDKGSPSQKHMTYRDLISFYGSGMGTVYELLDYAIQNPTMDHKQWVEVAWAVDEKKYLRAGVWLEPGNRTFEVLRVESYTLVPRDSLIWRQPSC